MTESIQKIKIGFIGGGNMATSLIGGLIANGDVPPKNISLFEPNSDRLTELVNKFGISPADGNESLAETCDVLVIAVKPQIMNKVLEPLAGSFKNNNPLIVSVAAGILVNSIEKWLDQELPVVRVMPNTPALIGKGAAGLFANTRVSAEQRALTTQMMKSIGVASWVKSESDIDSITALSGSGPAYFMLFIQGLIESSVKAGIDADTAKTLAVQTALGTAELINSSELDLQTLIDNVTSPNGTTEQALKSFVNQDLKGSIQSAFDAARIRSEQLAKELG